MINDKTPQQQYRRLSPEEIDRLNLSVKQSLEEERESRQKLQNKERIMDEHDTNEILLLALRQLRAQSEFLSDFAAQFQAIYDYLEEHDPKFAEAFAYGEASAKHALSQTKEQTTHQLDDIIRKLESLRPLHDS